MGNELEFIRLSWSDFTANIKNNKSFKKFEQFNVEQMVNVLTENYEVLTIDEFLKYVMEYDSVGGWLDDMFFFIHQQIQSPHKKKKKTLQKARESMEYDHNLDDTVIAHEDAMNLHQFDKIHDIKQHFISSSESMMENVIKSQITPKMNELIKKMSNIQEFVDQYKHKMDSDKNILNEDEKIISLLPTRVRPSSVIVHSTEDEETEDSLDGHSDHDIFASLDQIERQQ